MHGVDTMTNSQASNQQPPSAQDEPADGRIVLLQDCPAIQIPNGNEVTVRAGTRMLIMHQLGDSFTVRTDQGYLLRIDGTFADALGIAPLAKAPPADCDPNAPFSDELLWAALRTCYDPELPANIVDLGLIYECIATPRADNLGMDVAVEMTLTNPGCGMGQVIQDDVENKLLAVPQVYSVRINLVFSPPWEQSMMSESARLALGMM